MSTPPPGPPDDFDPTTRRAEESWPRYQAASPDGHYPAPGGESYAPGGESYPGGAGSPGYPAPGGAAYPGVPGYPASGGYPESDSWQQGHHPPEGAYAEPQIPGLTMWQTPDEEPPTRQNRKLAVAALVAAGGALAFVWVFPVGIALGATAVVLGIVALIRAPAHRPLAIVGAASGSVTAIAAGALLIALGSITPFGGSDPASAAASASSTKPSSKSTSKPSASPSSGTGTASPSPALTPGRTSGDYELAGWAEDFALNGQLIGTVKLNDLTMDVYQVATGKASSATTWLTPDDPAYVAEGDDIVQLQYVVTNKGKEPVRTSIALVSSTFYYADSPKSDTGSYVDYELLIDNGIPVVGVTTDTLSMDYLEWEPETSYSEGVGLEYRPGANVNIDLRFMPVDDNGEFLSEEYQEGTGTITLQ